MPASHNRWWALVVLCLGVLMIVLDTTIVNVALPSIRTDLAFTETSLVWVVNAYMLTFGGFLLLGGRLGDLYGHRRLFLIGLAVFTLASLACGVARTQAVLVVARAVQGLGGAVVSAVALSLIMNLFTEPRERARAMGVYGFVCAGGGSVGVLLGGLLTSAFSWHWIFLVNLPIGVAVAVACRTLLPAGGGQPRAEAGLGRRGHGHGIPPAGGVRRRQRQRGGLDLRAHARPARRGRCPDGRLPRDRGAGGGAAGAAGPVPPPQPHHRQHRRGAVGRGDVRLVLHVGPVHAAGAGLHADAGGPGVPSRQHHHGPDVARPVGPHRDALRHPRAARRRTAAGRTGPGAVRAGAGGRHVLGPRVARAWCCSAWARASRSIR